ncbi:MAG: hypothetical protein KGN02_14205 [bacterium]|nr:hypothetical protein [bacterium]
MKKLFVAALASGVLAACSAGSHAMLPQRASGPVQPAAIGVSQPHLFRPRPAAGARAVEATSTGPLIYRGGYIQAGSNLLIVTWGFAPGDTTRDPYGVANKVTALAKTLDNSANGTWNNTVSQYTGLTGSPPYTTAANTHDYVAQWSDLGSTPPNGYTDAQAQAEVARAQAYLGNSNGWAFVLITPTHISASGFVTNWCGYHSAIGYSSYIVLPYMPDAGGSCGENFVNGGAAGINDGTTIVAGHEIGEMVTDPFPNSANAGWTDSSGSEIGDKCAWTGLQNVTFPNGASFAMQPLYSNASGGCVQTYTTPTPVPTTPRPSPTAIPTKPPCTSRYCYE